MRPGRPTTAALLLAAVVAACGGKDARAPTASPIARAAGPAWVGAASCVECHRRQHKVWSSSHHAMAMRPATRETVLADFDGSRFDFAGATTTFRRDGDRYLLTAEDADGVARERPVAYTFGWWPLQQYLVPFERGRYQVTDLCWDARDRSRGGGRWYRLRPEEGRIPPGDLLHWTGPYQRWNLMCAECHSTDLRKGYRPATDAYETRWAEVNVACEACHGPGGRHVAWARRAAADREGADREHGPDLGLTVILKDRGPVDWKLDLAAGQWKRVPVERSRAEVETCARCHARRTTLAEADPGTPFLDTHLPQLLHEGYYFADGQILEEVYEHQSFLQSRMYGQGVTCSDCHGQHGSKARVEGASKACANCHLNERFAARTHHFHEPGTKGAECVACHMPTRTYMEVHVRRDHSIRIPRPDLTRKIGVPNACDDCHRDKGAEWAETWYAKWWGRKRLDAPHWGEALHAGREGAPGAEAALVAVAGDRLVPAIARATAVSLLGEHATAGSLDVLRRAARDPDDLVRLGAAEAGGRLPAEARWAVLDGLLDDPRRAVRVEAARSLAVVRASAASDARRARLDAVLDEFRSTQAYNADWAEGRANLGNLSRDLGDAAGAEREYREAVARNPAFGPVRANLADLLREQGREADAEATLREGLALSPKDPGLHHALGLLLVRRGQRTEAIDHLRRAAELAPGEARYAYVLAVGLFSTGDAPGARSALRTILGRRPWDPDCLLLEADLALRAGDRAAARAAVVRLLTARPGDPRATALLESIDGR